MTDPTQPGDELGPGAGQSYPPPAAPYDPNQPYDPHQPYGTTEVVEPPKSKRGLVIGGLAAVLAVVAGAAVWATTTLSGGGRQPDEVVPKSTFAYVKVDLDPAANQKLAARAFFEKIPQVRDKISDEDSVFEDLVADLVSDEEIDYNKDIKPWFDKRLAVAVFPSSGKEPHIVVALRSKDDGKARAALDRELAEDRADGDDVEYRINKGYALIGDKASVDEAVKQTAEESMADNATYQADIARLEGDQVVTSWADAGQVFDAIMAAFPFGAIPGGTAEQIDGRFVAGLHMTNDYAEVQGYLLGAPPQTVTPGGEHTLLAGLPADTIAAISGFGGPDNLKANPESLEMLDAMLSLYLQGSGLTFTGDILPLIGEQMVVAAGGFSLADIRAGILSKVENPAKAKASGQKILSLLQVFGGPPVKSAVKGDTFVLATPGRYADQLLAGGGGLTRTPKFEKATGDIAGATFIAYVDLPAVLAGAGATDPTGLTSAGLVVGFKGNEGYFRVRVVAD